MKNWRRKWQPTPIFLPGKTQGFGIWPKVHGATENLMQLSSI